MVNDITEMCDFCFVFRFSLTHHGERFHMKQTLKSKYKTFLFGIENSDYYAVISGVTNCSKFWCEISAFTHNFKIAMVTFRMAPQCQYGVIVSRKSC